MGIMMIITMIMLIRHAYAGFTIPIATTTTTAIIIPIRTGTTIIHGTLATAFTWVTTGGGLHFRSVITRGIRILLVDGDMAVITDMVTDMVMALDMEACGTGTIMVTVMDTMTDTTATIITAMIKIRGIMVTVVQ